MMVDITNDTVKKTSKLYIPIDKISYITTIDCSAIKDRIEYLKECKQLINISGQQAGITLIETTDGKGFVTSIKATTINQRLLKLLGGNKNGKGNSKN